MTQVELNSRGEPLLHPDIDEIFGIIAAHGCRVALQTNATLLRPSTVRRMAGLLGTVSLSVDAVGDRFGALRRGGNWADVDAGTRALLAERDPDRLKVTLYPTVTRRSLDQLEPLLDWALSVGVDAVLLHHYDPLPAILNPEEEAPGTQEAAGLRARALDWTARHPDGPTVMLQGEMLFANPSRHYYPPPPPSRPDSPSPSHPIPRARRGAHPQRLCCAPFQYVEVGIEGELSVCSRTQKTILGRATSAEEFAAAWTGPAYWAIRASLLRGEGAEAQRPAGLPAVLGECAGCVATYVQEETRDGDLAATARALGFSGEKAAGGALMLTHPKMPMPLHLPAGGAPLVARQMLIDAVDRFNLALEETASA